ncbi:hypothetical protein F511_08834 [Dorcoceras hygrometricum]|uniref:Cardiolipin synthase N-terminal domain-containing protein n=1 Tax=Dorcoceras hygrometricum TaxID=472368 RepID=A0A2Z7AIG6_9LAMI|nr:hypothetical protein F511_08834 [Dorcoceras hygrometricum]
MIASASIISCNFSSLPFKHKFSLSKSPFSSPKTSSILLTNHKNSLNISRIPSFLHTENLQKKDRLHTCQSSSNTKIPQDPSPVSSSEEEDEENENLLENGDGGNGNREERDWTTSFLLFAFWGGLMYYVFLLSPNQTPETDSYFLKKLLNLEGDDGFKMNEVIVALWYIMGLWPLVYSMLLLPTARSSRSKIPLWPFLVLSFFGGAYLLIPYFVLWRPPAPEVEESETRRWPLNFLESKLTAGLTFTAGLAFIVYAILGGGDVWKEFYQYFRGSKFIHVTTIDFALLSAFAPFWVYNDMTARKWDDKSSWLLRLSPIPFLGPALYLLLRPSLPVASTSLKGASVDDK